MTSIGSPEPFEIRVFSTLNAPGPLGFVVAGGLFIIANRRGLFPLLARAVGFLSLILCMGRSAWISWLLGSLYLASRRKDQAVRLAITAILLAACVGLAITYEPLQERIRTRFESFAQLSDDQSYGDRRSGSERVVRLLMQNPLGGGLGAADAMFSEKMGDLGTHDNGAWEVFLSLGWVSGAAYLSALLLSLLYVFLKAPRDLFIATAGAAVAIGMVPQMLLGSVMINVSGMMLWSFIGISIGCSCNLPDRKPFAAARFWLPPVPLEPTRS